MHAYRTVVLAAVGVVAVALGALAASAQVPGTVQEFGRPVVPMFEGWYFNQDGTATILVGFFNPNQTQTVDLPVGELNQFRRVLRIVVSPRTFLQVEAGGS